MSKSDKILKKDFIMTVSKELLNLYTCRDYARWKMESFRGSNKFNKARKLLNYYNKEIENFSKKKHILKQLSLF